MVLRRGAVVDSDRGQASDRARWRRIPIAPGTAFDIASDAKQFTPSGDDPPQEGRLDYDAPVVRFLPELSRSGRG